MTESSGAGGGHRVRRRREKFYSSDPRGRRPSSSSREPVARPELDISELRRRRIEKLEGSVLTHGSTINPTMTSHSRTKESQSNPPSSEHRKKSHHKSSEDSKHRSHKSSTTKDERSREDNVATEPKAKSHTTRVIIAETSRRGRDRESSNTRSASTPSRHTRHKAEDESRASKHSSKKHHHSAIDSKDTDASSNRDKPHTSRKTSVEGPRKERSSSKDPVKDTKSSPKKSGSAEAHKSPSKSHRKEGSSISSSGSDKRPSLLGSFFGSALPTHPEEPPKLVECLICMSDDIPVHKSAKLKCGHRMCHSCLKRAFRLSIQDPQHMPPKCCTSAHIPLKHVERLFDTDFKKTWNKKFAEYTTKNRIYCPSKRCGEWIKPQNIHMENGRKYGKCSRCKTKVCCQCNGKWHGSKDCPKDEETNKLLEKAKEAGWQRCYNCRAMVELKEGCNHMTCRCTAEFCMLCGLKWKSCNCPWFNYDQADQDRLNHMRIPEPVVGMRARPENIELARARRRANRPQTYNEELNLRRRQERMDEILARRLQRLAFDDNNDYQGGLGDIHGIGNAAGHFMNENFVRATHNLLDGNFFGLRAGRQRDRVPTVDPIRGTTPPARPIVRRHTLRELPVTDPRPGREAERLIPRRTRTDYATEAAIYAPTTRSSLHRTSTSVSDAPTKRAQSPPPSVLAGLGTRSDRARVDLWRAHVEPGEPKEGSVNEL
ncbi:hypothetical protein F5884DRAFT_738368 [Xylogone sp. PMI_703]|nr:hypothetical protein F5884DRAFT_738368 [Xylogone sp. PMI_703]